MVTWKTTWTGAAEQAAGRAAAMRSETYAQMPLTTKIMGLFMLVVVVLLLVGLVVVGLIVAVPLILLSLIVTTARRLLGGFSSPTVSSQGRENVKVIERRE